MFRNIFSNKQKTESVVTKTETEQIDCLAREAQLTPLESACLDLLEQRDWRGISTIEMYGEELSNPSRLIDGLRQKGCVIFEKKISYCDKRGQWRHNVNHYTLLSKGTYICH